MKGIYTEYVIDALKTIYMAKPKTQSDDLQSVEKLIVLNLARNKPQTKRETAKAISKHYKSTWDAYKRLEEKKLIQPASTKPYNTIDYPRYWLTDEGIMRALIEGAKPERMLKQVKILYPDAKPTHVFLTIAQFVHSEVLKMVYSSVKGKNKIGLREILIVFLSQPSIAMDDDAAKKIATALKEYPEEYALIREKLEEMKNQLERVKSTIFSK